MEELNQLMPHIVKPTESDELNELFTALAKAQGEMEVAKQDSSNPYFKSRYADLAAIVKASRDVLSKNGLSVVQRIIGYQDGAPKLYTRLCHSSGQWMESSMPINPPKSDIQSLGSYITYLRRYNYASMVCVVSAYEDDDGERAMERNRSSTKPPVKPPNGKISSAQLQVLNLELDGHDQILESLLEGFGIRKLSDLSEKSFNNCIGRIREIKKAKET